MTSNGKSDLAKVVLKALKNAPAQKPVKPSNRTAALLRSLLNK